MNSITSAPQDPASLIRDAEATEREVGSTLIQVTVIGMVASLFAAGVYGWRLSGGDILITIKTVLVAVAIDLLLFRWLRVAKRLRKIGAHTPEGKVLDVAGVLMTYYLSGLGGFAVLIAPQSMLAWGLMGVTYLFIPTVMLLSYLAMPGAQQVLQETRDAAIAEEDRKRQAAIGAQETKYRAEQNRRDELQKSSDSARVAEANKGIREAELAAEERGREMQNEREERAQRDRHLALTIALATTLRLPPLRRRPRSRPSARPTSVPARRPKTVPVTDDLLSQARRLRATREAEGKTAGRSVLQHELNISERTAKELARRLDETPLHIVAGGLG